MRNLLIFFLITTTIIVGGVCLLVQYEPEHTLNKYGDGTVTEHEYIKIKDVDGNCYLLRAGNFSTLTECDCE